MLVVATGLTQAPNDKQQIKPMLGTIAEQVRKLGVVQTLIANTGYCSEKNILACEEAKITPLIAVAREDHHPHWRERFTEPAPTHPNWLMSWGHGCWASWTATTATPTSVRCAVTA